MRHFPLIFINNRLPEMEYHLPPVRLAGYVGWKLTRGGKVIRESPLQKNLITNSGLNALGAGLSFAGAQFGACGTSASAPLATDSALGAEVNPGRITQANITNGYVAIGGAVTQDYQWRRATFTFLEPNANGNLTEFGTFTSGAFGGGSMFARQLFKDIGGTPTTVVKTNADQLEVTYEWRAYPPLVDTTLTAFAISGDAITTDITIRPNSVNAAWASAIFTTPVTSGGALAYEDNALVARTSDKSTGLTNNGSDSAVFSAYTPGTFLVDETIKFEPPNTNFATGIGYFKLYTYAAGIYLYQASLTTKIPKTNVKRTTLVVRRSWARFP